MQEPTLTSRHCVGADGSGVVADLQPFGNARKLVTGGGGGLSRAPERWSRHWVWVHWIAQSAGPTVPAIAKWISSETGRQL